MKNTYKLILFLLLITQASFGQDVKGYIKDAESKETKGVREELCLI